MPLALNFFNRLSLEEHFDDHGSDFCAINEDEYDYLNKAIAFLQVPLSSDADLVECIRLNGDIVRFNKRTHHFAVVRPNGVIRTYYIPMPRHLAPLGRPVAQTHGFTTNLLYYNSECLK